MAFESKTIFKQEKIYQSIGMDPSLHEKNCRFHERGSGELKSGHTEDAELVG